MKMPRSYWPELDSYERWDRGEQDFVQVYTTRLRDKPETLFVHFEQLCRKALDMACAAPNGTLRPKFDFIARGCNLEHIEHLLEQQGWLELSKIDCGDRFDSLQSLVITGCTDDGSALDDLMCRRLIVLPFEFGAYSRASLPDMSHSRTEAVMAHLARLNSSESVAGKAEAQRLTDEVALLDQWAEEVTEHLEQEISTIGEATTASREETRQEKRQELLNVSLGISVLRQHLVRKSQERFAALKTASVLPLATVRWRLLRDRPPDGL